MVFCQQSLSTKSKCRFIYINLTFMFKGRFNLIWMWRWMLEWSGEFASKTMGEHHNNGVGLEIPRKMVNILRPIHYKYLISKSLWWGSWPTFRLQAMIIFSYQHAIHCYFHLMCLHMFPMKIVVLQWHCIDLIGNSLWINTTLNESISHCEYP